jgi:hypothetical protein
LTVQVEAFESLPGSGHDLLNINRAQLVHRVDHPMPVSAN